MLEQDCGYPNYSCPVNKMKSSRNFGAMRNSLSSLNPEVTCQSLQFLAWNNWIFSVLLYIC